MNKNEALEKVGDTRGNAFLDFNTRYGSFWKEPRENGYVDYEFSEEEQAAADEINGAEDLPWDDEHIVRVWDDDGNILFGRR